MSQGTAFGGPSLFEEVEAHKYHKGRPKGRKALTEAQAAAMVARYLAGESAAVLQAEFGIKGTCFRGHVRAAKAVGTACIAGEKPKHNK